MLNFEEELTKYRDKLEEALAEAEKSLNRLSNKASGARLRKLSLEVGNMGKQLRKLSVLHYQ